MRTISVWAHHHKWAARLLIILLQLLLAVVAVLVGRMLLHTAVAIPLWCKYMLIVPTFALFFLYPSSQKIKSGLYYRQQKTVDVLLLLAGFLLIVCMGNNRTLSGSERTISFFPAWGVQNTTATLQNGSTAFSEEPGIKKPLSRIKAFKKSVKQHLQQLRKKYKTSSQTGKVALIILSILIAAALLMLIAALSCNIACAGSEAAAVLVLLAGGGLIIFVLVKVLQRIKRGPKIKAPAKPETPTPPVENGLPSQSF